MLTPCLPPARTETTFCSSTKHVSRTQEDGNGYYGSHFCCSPSMPMSHVSSGITSLLSGGLPVAVLLERSAGCHSPSCEQFAGYGALGDRCHLSALETPRSPLPALTFLTGASLQVLCGPCCHLGLSFSGVWPRCVCARSLQIFPLWSSFGFLNL